VKVLFLTTNWPTESSPVNGTFVREHARAAAERAEVAVFYLERAAGRRGAVDVVPIREEEPPAWRVRYRRFGRPISYAAFAAGPLVALRRLRREGFDPDILHAHSFLSALPALMLGRIYDKPVVYSEHWGIFLADNPGRLSPAMTRAARAALERAALVLPVSEKLGDALRGLAPRARLRVVPNVVDERLFRPGERRRSHHGARLVTAGLLDTDRKGVDLLLEALSRLSERDSIHLDVVGDGAMRPKYERLASRLGLEEAVTFHGLKSKAELAALMRNGDLFVLASRYENNPCVLLEAMVSGLPAVATRVGGVPDALGETAGVLVNPSDPNSLAAGIEDALDRLDDFDREQIAHRARKRYGRQAVSTQLADVYAEVAAR
jgi:glycosyltransferase involved in cell wall biosynthesis